MDGKTCKEQDLYAADKQTGRSSGGVLIEGRSAIAFKQQQIPGNVDNKENAKKQSRKSGYDLLPDGGFISRKCFIHSYIPEGHKNIACGFECEKGDL